MTTADWLRKKIGPAPQAEPLGASTAATPAQHSRFAFFTQFLRPDMRVLHAYFGNAGLSRALALHLSLGELVGIDPDIANVRLARSNGPPSGSAETTFERGKISDLQFADGEFDAVLLDGSLADQSSPERALEEVKRVLAPGGMLGARHTVAASRVLTGPSPVLERALNRREIVQRDLGADPDFGLRQPAVLRAAGFLNLHLTSSSEQATEDDLLAELTRGGFVPNVDDGSDADDGSPPVTSFLVAVQAVCWKPA